MHDLIIIGLLCLIYLRLLGKDSSPSSPSPPAEPQGKSDFYRLGYNLARYISRKRSQG
jgi:hypothetical protein